MHWLGFLPWWIVVPYILLWLYVMATLIMEDREPADTLAWAFALLLVPVLGMIFYFIAGRDWATITEKKKWMRDYYEQLQTALKPFFARNSAAERRFRQEYGGTYVERLADTMAREDGLGVVTADRAEIFPTGQEKFSRLKADLAAAQKFIHIQYFIWEDDELTDALTEILKERVQAGVQVRFLYDYLGSKHWDKTKLEALMPLGAKVEKDVVSISHLNYRDHRKIVVIDGEIGYTGGYNVGQEYVDGGERFAVWRDTHVRVTGQVVGELEALFAARWFDQTKEDVCTDAYLPERPRGDAEAGILCQVIAQSVEDYWKSSRRAHMIAVGNAAKRVWIQSPYFIPEVGLYDTMINASLSGVDVRFMMTGVPDKKVPFWAAWTYFRPLLKAGVKVYLYEAGFLHSKTLTADGKITAIGTMNMDIRSLRLHKELMLWMYDDKLAYRQERLYEDDIANSHEVTLMDLDALSLTVRFRNSFMRLLSYFI
jgi:cardiolipin synthase A/B